MFGNLGTSQNPNPGTGTGFGEHLSSFTLGQLSSPQTGGFGANTPAANASNSLFGGAKPATGFGAFGTGTSTATFGGGGVFGQSTSTAPNTTGTGLFGQPTTSTGFSGGTGTGLFGKPATSGFGPAQSK